MDSYNFWQDFFDTYQSLSDWMKVLWLIVPPAFVLGLVALAMRFRIDNKRADHGLSGKLIYPRRANQNAPAAPHSAFRESRFDFA